MTPPKPLLWILAVVTFAAPVAFERLILGYAWTSIFAGMLSGIPLGLFISVLLFDEPQTVKP